MPLLLTLNSLTLSIMALMSFMGNALCQDLSKKVVLPRGYYDDVPNQDVVGFILVLSVSLTSMIFGLAGIVFVLLRIYVKWKDTERALSMALRVPLYLGALNSIMWVSALINLTYTAIHHTPLPGKTCKIVAGMTTTFAILERFMVASIAITTYLRVCRKIHWNYGEYDWKIWLTSGLISILVTSIGSSQFGPTAYWCDVVRNSPFVLLVGLGISVLILLVCAYCYFRTVVTIRAVIKQVSSSNNNRSHHQSHSATGNDISDVESKVTKKVMGYIIVFLIQWFPAFPYEIYGALKRDDAWVYALAAASINMGCIGNAICFVVNEGWGLHGNKYSRNESENMSTTAVSSNFKDMGGSDCNDNGDVSINSMPLVELSQAVINGDGIQKDFVGV